MTSLLSARRRAEEFAAAVDTPDGPSASPALADLVELVGALRAQKPPAARPEFTASLRERLLAEADEILVQDAALTLPRRRTGARERRLAIAASTFVLVGGSAGLAAAAQHALPGDALYPIKRGIESAHTGLSTNRADKGRDLLSQADSRLAELDGLLRENSGSVDDTEVPATIRDFALQAQQGSQMLLDSYAQDQDPADVVAIRKFAAQGLLSLQELAKKAPAEEQDNLAQVAGLLQKIDRDAAGACSACASDLPALQLPPSLLTSADVNRALDRIQRTQLNNDHPSLSTGPVKGTHPGKGDGSGSGTGSSTGTGTGPTKDGTVPGDGPTDGDGDGTGPTGDGKPKGPDLPTGGGGVKKGVHKGLKDLHDKVGETGNATKKVLKDPLDPILKGLLP